MLEDLDALNAKMAELSGRMRALREENQRLRTQLATANVELDTLRGRVAGAMERIEALLARLPPPAGSAAESASNAR
jgi:outer membrane murein-binding lipoprotein Lpp